jgi:hypothetical protein
MKMYGPYSAQGNREQDNMKDVSEDIINNVKKPSHYWLLGDIEAIDVITRTLTKEQFYGYCLGNILKYKLRAGAKDDTTQDLLKSEEYKKIYDKFLSQCRED